MLKLELEQCVSRLARALLEGGDGQGMDDEVEEEVQWIVPFVETCAWFEGQINLLTALFTYLDRVYALEQPNLTSVQTLAHTLFRDRILGDSAIHQRITRAIKGWLSYERAGDDRPEMDAAAGHDLRATMNTLFTHLRTHGHFAVFAAVYVSATTEWYDVEAQEAERSARAGGEPGEFIAQCERRIAEEMVRAEKVFVPQKKPDGSVKKEEGAKSEEKSVYELMGLEQVETVRRATERVWLGGRVVWLAGDALGQALARCDAERVARMYALFARVGEDAVKALAGAFKAHILDTVQKIVLDTPHDAEMVPRLVELRTFGKGLLARAFVDAVPQAPDAEGAPLAPAATVPNRSYFDALKDAFMGGFKARRSKPAEMIAKALDAMLRRGKRDRTDAEFMAELTEILELCRFTDDKDVFRAFYQRALAKRLLLQRSASDDVERTVLKVLQTDYDPDFSMGDHMFNDLALSNDLYNEYRRQNGDAVMEEGIGNLFVTVVQRSSWPFSARTKDAVLPNMMQKELEGYYNFYKSKHGNHKLDFDHALGTATVVARFDAGKKELTLTLYQAIVLLLFNEEAELPFGRIAEATAMDATELRRVLQSLACGKKKVLLKKPPGKEVGDGDVFRYNAEFTDAKYKVHISSILVHDTPEESRRTQRTIEGERRYIIDAAIVRVMKARKTVRHKDLMTATVDAVKNHFVPDVVDVKKRIDGLVDEEYMRRDEEDRTLFHYIA